MDKISLNKNSYFFLFNKDYFNIKIIYLMDMFCGKYVETYPLEEGAYYVASFGFEDYKNFFKKDFELFKLGYAYFIKFQMENYGIR